MSTLPCSPPVIGWATKPLRSLQAVASPPLVTLTVILAFLTGLRFYPNAPVVAFYNFFTNGQPNAGARVLLPVVQALENNKNSFKILRLNAYAVVLHRKNPHIVVTSRYLFGFGGDMDVGGRLAERPGDVRRLGRLGYVRRHGNERQIN